MPAVQIEKVDDRGIWFFCVVAGRRDVVGYSTLEAVSRRCSALVLGAVAAVHA